MAELAIRTVVKQDGQSVVSPRVRLGEPFLVEITVTSEKDVVVNLPQAALAEPFEIVAHKETSVPAGDGLVDRTFALSVVAWEPGKKTLPAIKLQTVVASEMKEVTTEPLEVEVLGVVAGERPDDLRPGGLAGPVSVYQQDLRLLWIGAGLLGLFVLFFFQRWVRRRLARRVPKVPVPVLDLRPPHEIALAKLAALGVYESGDPRPFYFALTEIVREYLGRRFGFDALEQTTTELLASLDATRAAAPHVADVRGWLEACDLVKFASVKVSGADAQAALDAARRLVERTIPPPPTPEAPAAAEVRA
jgi:hypothetical protein